MYGGIFICARSYESHTDNQRQEIQASASYYTSDVTIPKSKLQRNVVLVSGFKKDYSSEEVMKLIPTHVASHVFDDYLSTNLTSRLSVLRHRESLTPHPGLSEKFLYLNDDVMFGDQVWPDDSTLTAKDRR
ncbi:hypothetical protein EB796_005930 [Bugula neritina]|uniref:Uncharacterized protein n=1 Tax=Bugula neritina TaxID=10212 RepID=A0A7J7KDZ7_BUGNE|nr:hypothetical protein EB796_005930 [Bugula neritina]